MLSCKSLLHYHHFPETHNSVCKELVGIIKSYKPEWSVFKEVIFRRRDAVTHEDDRVTVGVHADGTIVAQTTGPEAEVSPDDSSRSTKLLADIVFVTDTNDEYLIDVTVAAPSAPSYVNSRTSSSDIAGATCVRHAHDRLSNAGLSSQCATKLLSMRTWCRTMFCSFPLQWKSAADSVLKPKILSRC